MSDKQISDVDLASEESPHFTSDQQPQTFAAWEEVEAGRFMPRRVRGSCQGRALG
ncbi:MAG: hypothetical protein KDA96_27075 [Planctomycetaceae bacterium]|nr:hypothetical protein [Planctomycetaceae bacterium]